MQIKTNVLFECQWCGKRDSLKNGEWVYNKVVLREDDHNTGTFIVFKCNFCEKEVDFHGPSIPVEFVNNMLSDLGLISNRNYMKVPEGWPNPYIKSIEADEQYAQWREETAVRKAEYAKRPPSYIRLVHATYTPKTKFSGVHTYHAYRVHKFGSDNLGSIWEIRQRDFYGNWPKENPYRTSSTYSVGRFSYNSCNQKHGLERAEAALRNHINLQCQSAVYRTVSEEEFRKIMKESLRVG